MKKIPTLFVREFEGHKIKRITREFTNEECKRAFLEGTPTIKFDGACCAIIDGGLYKRYDAKNGKPVPEGAIKCQKEPDPITGHLPCWVKVEYLNPADIWFRKAYENYEMLYGAPEGGTYEAIGKHFQGNPYNRCYDILIPHGRDITILEERTFEGVKKFLETFPQEGLVFWLDGKPICKIKRTDFGLKWPIKEKENE